MQSQSLARILFAGQRQVNATGLARFTCRYTRKKTGPNCRRASSPP